MCLSQAVHHQNEIPEKFKSGIGYKIMKLNDKKRFGIFKSYSGAHYQCNEKGLIKNWFYHSSKDVILGDCFSYPAGFHIYTNIRDTADVSQYYRVVKVQYEDTVFVGMNNLDDLGETVIARKMKILGEVNPNEELVG